MKRVLTGEIPLVSRESELNRIVTALRGPAPAAFVLAGPAGVGKTRLAAEAARSAAVMGFTTAAAVASRAAASIPFGPFAPFLPTAGQIASDLPGLLRQASDAIMARGGPDRRLLLVVDDAQLLDDGSAALVHQLVRERTCSVLASTLTPGQAPDPVTALWRDGLAERIELGAWSEPETEAVLTAFLGGPVARGSVRRLWEASGGNALYLRELLIGATSSGALREEGGIWSLRLPLAAPGRLVELVASRLAGLDQQAVAVIELLAIGEPLGLSLVEQIADPAGLAQAQAAGFVRVDQDGQRIEARLSHPVYGEALRQSLPRSVLRRMSTTLAGAVQATGARRREDLLRLGRWQLDSGASADPALLSEAARMAAEVFDMELAGRLARTALDLGGGVDAGLVLGESKFRSGQHAEAESVLAGLVPLCGTDADLAKVANARVHNLHNLLGDPDAATAVLDQALAVVTEAAPRLQLLGRLATMKCFEPDPVAALAAAGPLLASDDDAMVSRGAFASSISLALLGRTQEAVSVARLGLASHRRATGVHQLPEAQLIGAVHGLLAGGRLAQAQADAAAGYQACLTAGDKEGQATFLFLAGCVLIERGLPGRAGSAFADGASVNREIGDLAALRWCLAGLAFAQALSGHASLALAAAAERDQLPVSPMTLYETDLVDRGRAWVSVATGELSLARQILTGAAARAAAGQLRVAEARLLHDVARLGQPELVATRLAALAEQVDGELVAALAGHATALVHGTAADLEAAGQRFDRIGACLLAAEAYQAAAVSYRAAGYARPASATARLAAERVKSCGEVRTPALSLGQDADRLTRREREVAGLAAAGTPSRDIAAKLALSVRTVENHLQSAYLKLGVTSREELAELLRG